MKKSRLDKVFEVSVTLKGLDGLLELAGGIILIFVSPELINHVTTALTQHELSEDPHDFIANHILNYSHHLSASTITFGAIYLVAHGLVKIILVVAVLKEKIWAYPWMIIFLVTFIIYQLYRIILVKFSIGLTLLTLFDGFIVYLTVLEYKKHRLKPETVKVDGDS